MTPRWKDKLGRVWEHKGHDVVIGVDHPTLGPVYRKLVEEIVGPLEPVEERCRVRVAAEGSAFYAAEDGGRISAHGSVGKLYATTWPRARAEEIAAACRVLGWDAVVEVVE